MEVLGGFAVVDEQADIFVSRIAHRGAHGHHRLHFVHEQDQPLVAEPPQEQDQ
jgi:hypothetical protein